MKGKFHCVSYGGPGGRDLDSVSQERNLDPSGISLSLSGISLGLSGTQSRSLRNQSQERIFIPQESVSQEQYTVSQEQFLCRGSWPSLSRTLSQDSDYN